VTLDVEEKGKKKKKKRLPGDQPNLRCKINSVWIPDVNMLDIQGCPGFS